MTKSIKLIFATLIFLTISSGIMAQDVSKDAPSSQTDKPLTAPQKSCHMADYCAKMKQPPKKGFHHSIEWGGIYLGPSNQISYRMAGRTVSGDIRERNAIRMSAGYQFNPYLYVGGGMGAEFQRKEYDLLTVTVPEFKPTYTGSLYLVPFYGEIKGYLLNKPVSPFIQYRMGYAPAIYVGEGNRTVENASYNNISIGVRIFSHLSITAGYLFIYQPACVSGYDEQNHNTPVIDRSTPYQHRLTVGIALGM